MKLFAVATKTHWKSSVNLALLDFTIYLSTSLTCTGVQQAGDHSEISFEHLRVQQVLGKVLGEHRRRRVWVLGAILQVRVVIQTHAEVAEDLPGNGGFRQVGNIFFEGVGDVRNSEFSQT